MEKKTISRIQLRDYQHSLIQGIFEQWKTKPKVMAQLPTGGGKTVIFSAIADEFLRKQEKVLVLAHREELVTQAAGKLEAITGNPVGIIKAGYKPNPLFPVQVASVQSLVNRLNQYPDFGLVVIDESHHAICATYRQILEAYPNAYWLGVTATPIRTDGSGFDDLFDALVTGPTVRELIDAGHLSPFRLFAAAAMNTKGVKSIAGDYSVAGLAKKNNVVTLSGQLVESYKAHCPDRRCLVFAISVDYSKAIADRYNAAGIPAVHLDGETPAEYRQEALSLFAEGKIKVISNCALFGEGLDIPAIDAVQIARPTKSLGLWLQMVGRALRPSPGKDHAVLIDHTKNWAIHGLPTRKRIWTLEGVEQEEEALECREGLGIIKKQVVEEEIRLVEVEDSPDNDAVPEDEWLIWYRQILGICSARGYNRGWLRYRLAEKRVPLWLWEHHGKTMGWNPKAAQFQYEAQEESFLAEVFPEEEDASQSPENPEIHAESIATWKGEVVFVGPIYGNSAHCLLPGGVEKFIPLAELCPM